MTKATRLQRPEKLPKGIRRLPNGKYIGDATYKGQRKTVTDADPITCYNKRQQLIEEMRAAYEASQDPGETYTILECFNDTIRHQWSSRKSLKTCHTNGMQAVSFFGETTPVSKIDTPWIMKYVEHLEDHNRNADSTINRKMTALSAMLKMAKRLKRLKELPEIPRREEREGRVRFLTEAEEAEVLRWFEYFDKKDHLEATIVLIDTGFRVGELWGVERVDVNLINNTIKLDLTKSGHSRSVPMTSRVRAIIERRCQAYPEGKLFPDARTNSWYRTGWDRVRTAMDMWEDPYFVPHILRHTCCSRLVQRGAPLTHVKKWMGHESIVTTMRYSHLAPDDLFSLASVLDGGASARWQAQAKPLAGGLFTGPQEEIAESFQNYVTQLSLNGQKIDPVHVTQLIEAIQPQVPNGQPKRL